MICYLSKAVKTRRQSIIRIGNRHSGNSDIAEAADFSYRQVELNMLTKSSHRAAVPAVKMVIRRVTQTKTCRPT